MPTVHDVHQRKLRHEVAEVDALIDWLARNGDRLRPAWRWPAQRLDAAFGRKPIAQRQLPTWVPVLRTLARRLPSLRRATSS